ncbi:helix-turn-helix domain-containing protein [Nitriliruptor alkaliphilus]|uniref:helix-turn-helix domain-containing protein n=1 Tax=Nitriliruptor alkaliphilus TaxID=427918 RepID=UPI00069899C7|nr:helix-turn-helix transcriptional regulator [Nitriliruptor alkaliphilus]
MDETTAPTTPTTAGFGAQLRSWRTRRRLSQQDLSLLAEVSTRHLSFLETGRSRPSRAMVLALAEHLAVPLRERNDLLLAAGHAPAYPHRPLDAPEMSAVRAAVDRILHGHEPLPAVAVDRRWDLVAANAPVAALTAGVSAEVLGPPTNVYRLTLHPGGLAPLIVNLEEVAHHLLDRLSRDLEATGDPDLAALHDEVRRYPTVSSLPTHIDVPTGVVVPFRLRHPQGQLNLFTTVTTFGTPADVTVSELALELFYPLDEATAARLTALAEAARATPADA